MKMISLTLLLLFLAIDSEADKNWIKINPQEQTKTLKSDTKADLNLSQIQPINRILRNATLIKQLIDNKRKEKPTANDKNWFVLNTKDSK
ncbi:hypothetical protein [Sulfurimonas sp.]|uniref:hypothetical protein n=1 Tax=Sulfurimonas sp. TaxID=2022749 RepID=UPI00356A1BBA